MATPAALDIDTYPMDIPSIEEICGHLPDNLSDHAMADTPIHKGDRILAAHAIEAECLASTSLSHLSEVNLETFNTARNRAHAIRNILSFFTFPENTALFKEMKEEFRKLQENTSKIQKHLKRLKNMAANHAQLREDIHGFEVVLDNMAIAKENRRTSQRDSRFLVSGSGHERAQKLGYSMTPPPTLVNNSIGTPTGDLINFYNDDFGINQEDNDVTRKQKFAFWLLR
ncbi:hypothetical protein AMATHDRAFT_41574 [Amanita thiersii Skay4041]|uniref:Uncharacterized protein n=1 Tax=Amanita thiersii Skay4041 TaxID=703135 RepID=A0A2A9NP04_9AGAR|nr:hypothetical protein AMATHDRAFT_41574 [Amanita thiersii Skay4041]